MALEVARSMGRLVKAVLSGPLWASMLLGFFALGGVIASMQIGSVVAARASSEWNTRVERRISNLAAQINRELERSSVQMRSLSVLFEASNDVTRQELRIAEASLSTGERRALLVGLAFTGLLRQDDGTATRSGGNNASTALALPIMLESDFSPILGSGQDLAQHPALGATSIRALESPGVPVMGPAFADAERWYAAIAVTARNADVNGVLIGLIDVERMFADVMQFTQSGLGLEVTQNQGGNSVAMNEPPDAAAIITTHGIPPVPTELTLRQTFTYDEARWSFTWHILPGFEGGADTATGWLIGIGGSVITLLVSMVLAALAYQNLLVRRQVLHRTEALAGALQRLAESDRAKSRFLSIVGHELRTPLNAIIGFGELLLHTQKEPTARTHLNFIVDAGQHLLGLVNDLLEVAHASRGTLELNQDACLPESLVTEAYRQCQTLAERAGVTLEVELAEDAPLIRADARRLSQALKSLCLNAITASRSGTTVTLALDYDNSDGMVRFRVRDNGKGLSPEQLREAHQLFEQLEDPMTRRQQGLGIGLPLCGHIVELHGGRLSLTSKLGKGTEAVIQLPPDACIQRHGPAPRLT